MFFKSSGLTTEQKNNAQERLITIATQYNSRKTIVSEPETKDKYGSMAPIVSVYQDHFYKIQQGQNKIQNEITNLNTKGIFTQNVLGNPGNIQQARTRLRNYLNEYKKYEGTVRDSITICKKKVSNNTKESTVFLTKIAKLADDNIASWEKFFKAEEGFIQKLDELLGYLAERQGKYTVTSSGQIQFNSSSANADVTAYNKIYKDMNSYIQNEVNAEKEMSQTNQKNIDALKANKDK
jgi:DNA-binding ferritin-like protein